MTHATANNTTTTTLSLPPHLMSLKAVAARLHGSNPAFGDLVAHHVTSRGGIVVEHWIDAAEGLHAYNQHVAVRAVFPVPGRGPVEYEIDILDGQVTVYKDSCASMSDLSKSEYCQAVDSLFPRLVPASDITEQMKELLEQEGFIRERRRALAEIWSNADADGMCLVL